MTGRKALVVLSVVVLSLILTLGLSGCDSNPKTTYRTNMWAISAATNEWIRANTTLGVDGIEEGAQARAGTTISLRRTGLSKANLEEYLRSLNFSQDYINARFIDLERMGYSWIVYETVTAGTFRLLTMRQE